MISLLDRRRQIRRDRDLRLAFQRTFRANANVKEFSAPVLAFLKSFCHATQSVILEAKDGSIDPFAITRAAGRQEVWHEIRRYLELDENDLLELDRWLKMQEEGIRRESLDAG